MKKIIVLILVAFTFLGCGNQIEFNTPSFQAQKDGNFWQAVTFSANINSSGVLTIVGSDNFKTITLEVNSTDPDIYDVTETISNGSFKDFDGVLYSTNNFPNANVQLYPAGGMIDLKEVNIEEGFVSGEFYFNAFNSSGLTSVNISKGYFYKVPLVGASVNTEDEDSSCSNATDVVADKLVDFNGASQGDANYVNVCNAYKTALIEQKTACGDPDNSIQTTIDGLSCM